ncbi:M3 family metallopeptidase [Aliiroseovarius sp. KMU-50]|uniref:M3 family metallopeptidase n=1 Tax=Aliiroseovarius salicola TaxID=3009082 RepID=A0ABT4VYW8_9RHOB|nr:M3 family metallopeptidase [Aliiroseovarius sp. KMU-50]MDA5093465.1 M3 family metallopeptidase [Aliiroseovarius sp. KMU-50]
MTNPLLAAWKTPHGLPPFDLIEDAHFEPAFDVTLSEARANVAAIAEAGGAPTFANTIEALERTEEALNRVLGVFYSVASADSTEKREELMRVFGPQLAAFGSEVSSNKALFARIEDLWGRRDELGLDEEQNRVLKLTRRGFVRSGAQLEGEAADRLKEIMQRLSVLGTEFTQNLLAAERDWFMELSEEDLEGLPDFVVAAARAAGKEKGANGPIITTSRSLITPFLAFSPRRDLRERAYAAWSARGEGEGEVDNRPIAAETLALREERARLLGYDSFAAFKLETEMAGAPASVREMLMAVWEPARTAALADEEVLTERLHADGFNGALEPWDWHYYSEARRKEEHDLDEAELKPYFQLERMIEAAFDCANRLFGLEFSEMDVPLYHEDARAWEITRGGRLMAVFVADFFARGSKRSGAWCGAMRSQQKLAGDIRPIVTNVCNFAKPADGQPALLSWDDARTLFHEFGHALHHILSDVTYESLSGTSVARDFVELPSQLYEHWLEVPEVLERFATHAETGEVIPADLLKRLLAANTYNTGFQTVEYTASALVDLDFHDGAAPADPMAAQAKTLTRIGMPNAIRMRHATPHFAHVFSGDGYSSGYYSYMWSEVMDADAFDAFKEAGGAFDAATADKLETNILSRGGSVEAKDLYLAFRGKMPGVEALLKGRGLA